MHQVEKNLSDDLLSKTRNPQQRKCMECANNEHYIQKCEHRLYELSMGFNKLHKKLDEVREDLQWYECENKTLREQVKRARNNRVISHQKGEDQSQ